MRVVSKGGGVAAAVRVFLETMGRGGKKTKMQYSRNHLHVEYQSNKMQRNYTTETRSYGQRSMVSKITERYKSSVLVVCVL